MTQTQNKPPVSEDRNPGITKKVTIKRSRTSPVKVFLRLMYWSITLTIVGIVLYISFEAGWTLYTNTVK